MGQMVLVKDPVWLQCPPHLGWFLSPLYLAPLQCLLDQMHFVVWYCSFLSVWFASSRSCIGLL